MEEGFALFRRLYTYMAYLSAYWLLLADAQDNAIFFIWIFFVWICSFGFVRLVFFRLTTNFVVSTEEHYCARDFIQYY